ncbi:MAG: hypothetical protein HUJ66_02950 [Oscillospiraceae bacterium]|nr:hypothetical protein [Oscillospiraceae bacterium]
MNDNTKPGRITDGICFTTEHVYSRSGEEIHYVCDAQEFIFLDEFEQPEASFFIYSYIRTDIKDKTTRPVLFSYGGGPGDASIPLGMWTPKIKNPQQGVSAPYLEPVDNPDWPIDATDIICIDPPGAGYAKIYNYAARSKYWGIQPDALAFIDMFKHWLTKYGRWLSPKYIAGTSYGGMRTAVLTDLLCGGPYYTDQRQYAHGIALNGAAISASSLELDMRSLDLNSAGYLISTAKSMRTYAAVNWYWNREGKPELIEFLNEADRFVADDYLRAQWLGTAMDKADKESFLKKFSYYCGLPASMLDKLPNYEIDVNVFINSLLADKGLRVSLYDGRDALPSSDTLGFFEDYADDPTNALGTFTVAPLARHYYRSFLGIELDREWLEVNFDANCQWTWTSNRSMIQHLESAMRRNPEMHTLIIGGVFDLAAGIGANKYALRHSGIDMSRILLVDLENSGHHTDRDPESSADYAQHLRDLIKRSTR